MSGTPESLDSKVTPQWLLPEASATSDKLMKNTPYGESPPAQNTNREARAADLKMQQTDGVYRVQPVSVKVGDSTLTGLLSGNQLVTTKGTYFVQSGDNGQYLVEKDNGNGQARGPAMQADLTIKPDMFSFNSTPRLIPTAADVALSASRSQTASNPSLEGAPHAAAPIAADSAARVAGTDSSVVNVPHATAVGDHVQAPGAQVDATVPVRVPTISSVNGTPLTTTTREVAPSPIAAKPLVAVETVPIAVPHPPTVSAESVPPVKEAQTVPALVPKMPTEATLSPLSSASQSSVSDKTLGADPVISRVTPAASSLVSPTASGAGSDGRSMPQTSISPDAAIRQSQDLAHLTSQFAGNDTPTRVAPVVPPLVSPAGMVNDKAIADVASLNHLTSQSAGNDTPTRVAPVVPPLVSVPDKAIADMTGRSLNQSAPTGLLTDKVPQGSAVVAPQNVGLSDKNVMPTSLSTIPIVDTFSGQPIHGEMMITDGNTIVVNGQKELIPGLDLGIAENRHFTIDLIKQLQALKSLKIDEFDPLHLSDLTKGLDASKLDKLQAFFVQNMDGAKMVSVDGMILKLTGILAATERSVRKDGATAQTTKQTDVADSTVPAPVANGAKETTVPAIANNAIAVEKHEPPKTGDTIANIAVKEPTLKIDPPSTVKDSVAAAVTGTSLEVGLPPARIDTKLDDRLSADAASRFIEQKIGVAATEKSKEDAVHGTRIENVKVDLDFVPATRAENVKVDLEVVPATRVENVRGHLEPVPATRVETVSVDLSPVPTDRIETRWDRLPILEIKDQTKDGQPEEQRARKEREEQRILALEEKARQDEAFLIMIQQRKLNEQKEKSLKEQEKVVEKDKKNHDDNKRRRYTVRHGDTVQSIAARQLREVKLASLIHSINRLAIPFVMQDGEPKYSIKEGQVIWLPSNNEIKQTLTAISRDGLRGKSQSAAEELETRFGANWGGDDSAQQTGATVLLGTQDIAVVEQRRRNIEKLLGKLSPKRAESGRIQYRVRLGDTLKSIALNHPTMSDVSLWKLLAEVNDLSMETDQKGSALAKLNRGTTLALPTVSEIEDYRSAVLASKAQTIGFRRVAYNSSAVITAL